jgi:hypothetical protein
MCIVWKRISEKRSGRIIPRVQVEVKAGNDMVVM